jgi:cytochrome c6
MRRVIQFTLALAISAAASPARAEGAAAAIYEKKCATCHGKDGKGHTKMGEKLGIKELAAVSAAGSATNAADVEKIVRDGKGKMPGFKDKLSDAEIKDLAAYVASGLNQGSRGNGGNASPQ